MVTLLVYKILVAALLVGVVGATAATNYYYGQANTKISQSSDLNNQVNQLNNQISQLQGQITAMNSEISSLNKQIDSLNSQIVQLQSTNTQLSGTNSQQAYQIQQLQSQVTQLQLQISQLQSQIAQLQTQVQSLTARLNLQASRTIASMVCIYSDCPGGGNGGNPVGNAVFVSLGVVNASGYIRVSWTGAHVSFNIQVYDVNVTTPVSTSGVFSIPVGANATGNAWFANMDCVPIPAGTFCPPVTYSMTYWY